MPPWTAWNRVRWPDWSASRAKTIVDKLMEPDVTTGSIIELDNGVSPDDGRINIKTCGNHLCLRKDGVSEIELEVI